MGSVVERVVNQIGRRRLAVQQPQVSRIRCDGVDTPHGLSSQSIKKSRWEAGLARMLIDDQWVETADSAAMQAA
jgi:hypothetical protein